MKRFFHVDQNNDLYEDQEINFIKFDNIKPDELQAHFNFLFPDGVSNLGYSLVVYRPVNDINDISNLTEMIFEYVRRSRFPEKPSRFRSFFAFDNIEQAILFRYKYLNCKYKIWEVEASKYFKADMSLLDTTPNNSLLQIDYHAHLYWNSETVDSYCTFWEFLLVPPVKVIRKVDG